MSFGAYASGSFSGEDLVVMAMRISGCCAWIIGGVRLSMNDVDQQPAWNLLCGTFFTF